MASTWSEHSPSWKQSHEQKTHHAGLYYICKLVHFISHSSLYFKACLSILCEHQTVQQLLITHFCDMSHIIAHPSQLPTTIQNAQNLHQHLYHPQWPCLPLSTCVQMPLKRATTITSEKTRPKPNTEDDEYEGMKAKGGKGGKEEQGKREMERPEGEEGMVSANQPPLPSPLTDSLGKPEMWRQVRMQLPLQVWKRRSEYPLPLF